MKKLYTLLLAVGVTLSAAAASPFQVKKNIANANTEVKFVESNKKATTTHKDLSKVVKNVEDFSVSASRAVEYPSFDRNYMLISYDDIEAKTADASTCHLYEDTSEGAGKGYYFLDGFIYSDADQIECTFETVQVEIDDEGNTMDVTVLVIPSQTPLFTISGRTYKLWLFGYTEDGPKIYSNNIEFYYAPNTGQLIFAYPDGMGIAWLSDDGYGDWLVDPTMVLPNGTYESVEINGFDEDKNPIGGEYMNDVFAQYSKEYQMILVANMCELGKVVYFTVDLDAREATATDQAIVDLYDVIEDERVYFSGYLASSMDATSRTPYVMNLNNNDGKCEMTSDFGYIVIDAESSGRETNLCYLILANTKLTLDFEIPDLATSGLNKVAVDANAPVEYYNLQGVRVENPTNGLYIKRQGNTATKVLVK